MNSAVREAVILIKLKYFSRQGAERCLTHRRKTTDIYYIRSAEQFRFYGSSQLTTYDLTGIHSTNVKKSYYEDQLKHVLFLDRAVHFIQRISVLINLLTNKLLHQQG